MGIVNITPDSFSDGGTFFDEDRAVAHGRRLAAEGADILDIGGESTRPFSDAVSLKEELQRVIPVIERLREDVTVPISIDTTKAEVARQAIAAGASIVNDVSALRADERMLDVVISNGVPLILMHMLGTPKTMQISPKYDNLFEEIISFLGEITDQAVKRGMERHKIIVDPGIGFGKTPEHNLTIIKHSRKLNVLGCPVLIGPSRKAFVRHILKPSEEKDLPPSDPLVATGTQAVLAVLAMNGTDILRVHDVAATRATLKMIHAIEQASVA